MLDNRHRRNLARTAAGLMFTGLAIAMLVLATADGLQPAVAQDNTPAGDGALRIEGYWLRGSDNLQLRITGREFGWPQEVMP
ncbi:MAG: hypothetical protein AB7K09_00795 [Planctomycetota bacterium]